MEALLRSSPIQAYDSTQRRRLLYAYMRLARDLDLRFAQLLKTGRVSKWYSQIGHESTTVAAGMALEAGDVLCSLHRDLGAILVHYLDPARAFPLLQLGAPDGLRPDPASLLYRLCCQLLGRADGFSQGIERSFHYALNAPHEGLRHFGMISHLGSMIPVAAGCAFGLKQQGGDRVAINFIGDGGTSTGDFHEGLNMAAVWRLPLVLIIENNRYAFSTPTAEQYAAKRLSDRGAGYGIVAETVDGNDPEEMLVAVQRAVSRARAQEGPTLIEAVLGRMRGHSEGDDSLKVVPKNELDTYMQADPVPRYGERLLADDVFTVDLQKQLHHHIETLVETAVARALESAPPEPATAERPVFLELPTPPPPPPPPPGPPAAQAATQSTYIEGVLQALREEMERDGQVVLMGQDIGRFEGAFRATKGLWQRWPDRVRDTPIAESGTLGIAAGAALLGYRPVVEMQFGDFISCGFNQLVNVIAKLYYRWQLACPMVIRLPVGGGVGAGPFHSQNPEAWFTHVAGLKVVCPATAEDAKLLLKAAIRDPNPVIFCEHKFLYRRIKGALPGADATPPPLGRAQIVRPGNAITLIGYGVSTWICLAAADALAKEDGVEAEVIDLRTLVPFDDEAVQRAVRRTGRAVVVHEAQRTSGFAGEIMARIAETCFDWLDAPLRRVTYPDRPSPYAKPLEQRLLPDARRVLATAREVLAH
ncbi:MAG: dehydrogenase E1 component subunit alpha/beta [Acidobacteriota bacterium]